jgi:threonine dehydratase
MNSDMADYTKIYEKIVDARKQLQGIAHITRLDHSSTFSRMTGGDMYLKLENLQKTGSFKVRGATYAISQLSDSEKNQGVIAASAGNHAQGVAYAATRLGIKSTIVMPLFSPIAKIQATKGYGADVILHGESFDDSLNFALEEAERSGAAFIHPFNNENIIAGQGTIGLELLKELPDVEAVAVPVGGGGLVSGIAIAIKETNPDVEIYGVEASSAASMKKSLKSGKPETVNGLDTVCDGIAVKTVGDLTLSIADDLLTSSVVVDDLQVTRTLFLLLERAKIVVEPAGCVGLTAFQYRTIDIEGKKAVAVLSGGNIDMSFMSRVIDKELYRLKRAIRLRGVILDRVGVLNRILEVVASSGVSVIDIEHDRSDPDIMPNKTELILTLQVPEENAVGQLIKELNARGFSMQLYED